MNVRTQSAKGMLSNTYVSLVIGHVGQAKREYGAFSVPTLVDPALRLPAMVVAATPGSA